MDKSAKSLIIIGAAVLLLNVAAMAAGEKMAGE